MALRRCLTVASGKIVARCIADVVATMLYLSALTRMPIADATAVLQFTPLAITAGRRCSWARRSAGGDGSRPSWASSAS